MHEIWNVQLGHQFWHMSNQGRCLVLKSYAKSSYSHVFLRPIRPLPTLQFLELLKNCNRKSRCVTKKYWLFLLYYFICNPCVYAFNTMNCVCALFISESRFMYVHIQPIIWIRVIGILAFVTSTHHPMFSMVFLGFVYNLLPYNTNGCCSFYTFFFI